MKFSQSFISNLKKSIDIVELIRRYTTLTFNGSVYVGKCPKPVNHERGRDEKPSFRVIPKEQSWFCGACHSGKKDTKCQHGKNFGSDCIAFMQWYHGYSWVQAVMELAELYDIPLESDEYEEMYEQMKWRALANHKNLPNNILRYLHDRGLTDETIKKFYIGYNGQEVTIPLLNRYKQFVGFTRRSFDSAQPKYKNSRNNEIFHKSSYFYGIHLVERDHPEVRIAEGAFDMILPHQFGVVNVLATLGTSFTEKHVEVIKNMHKTPVLCMDGDKAGLRGMHKAAEMLGESGISCKVLVLPDKMDMADLSLICKDKTEDYIMANAIPYSSFLMQELLKEYEAKIDELNLVMLPRFEETLAMIKNSSERKVIVDRIFRNTGLRL